MNITVGLGCLVALAVLGEITGLSEQQFGMEDQGEVLDMKSELLGKPSERRQGKSFCRRKLKGMCVRRKKPCPGHLSAQTSPGSPYCQKFHRCCHPALTTPPPQTSPPTTTYCQSQRTTVCPDDTRCHKNAHCYPGLNHYICSCDHGYAGDGSDCGTDTDLDGWPDDELDCCTTSSHCSADNCPDKPNSGQEDYNSNGVGDACGDPPPVPTGTTTQSPFCTPRKPHTNCTLTSNAWMTADTDGDGHVDSCDNCPHKSNVDQADLDGDRVGDVCDDDIDTDKDGVQDGIDNCIDVYNHGQSDVDSDGFGDECDDDADDDGIPNSKDNCWIIPNPGQEDTDNNGFGDACMDDKDGDCLPDHIDICPENPLIHGIDFRHFHKVSLDKSDSGQLQPVFVINDHGKEITQELNSKPGLMFGQHVLAGVDFDGTFYIDQNSDDDYAGFIFGYHGSKMFYVVMWKRHNQKYFEGTIKSMGEAGLALKRVHSTTGPSDYLADALWATKNSSDQVTLLWHDSNKIPWDYQTSYRWELIHRPHIGLIRVRTMTGAGVIADSGNIYDDDIKSGYLGVYCHSQEKIAWSNLVYRCNDKSVPQEVYDDLPSDKQAKVIVDPSKLWSGTVRTLKNVPNRKLVLHEPGMDDLTTPPSHK